MISQSHIASVFIHCYYGLVDSYLILILFKGLLSLTVAISVLRLYQIGFRDKVMAQVRLETRNSACSPWRGCGCIIIIVAFVITLALAYFCNLIIDLEMVDIWMD